MICSRSSSSCDNAGSGRRSIEPSYAIVTKWFRPSPADFLRRWHLLPDHQAAIAQCRPLSAVSHPVLGPVQFPMTPRAALSRHGELFFDDLVFTLPAAAAFGVFGSSALRARCSVHSAGDATVSRCDRELVFGSPFAVSLRFERDMLTTAELFLHLAGDGREWSSWSEPQEFKRKADAEAWASRVFGRSMVPMPIHADGVAIVPEWGERTPRQAVHDWGTIESFYDSKGGSSFMRIRYASA